MDRPWRCPLCPDSFAEAPALAYHAELWHDEWLTGNRIWPLYTGDDSW